MTEAMLKLRLYKWAKKHGGIVLYPDPAMTVGAPDVIIMMRGMVFFVEVKAPVGATRYRPRQKEMLRMLRERGHIAGVFKDPEWLTATPEDFADLLLGGEI